MHWPELYALSEMNYEEGRRVRSKPMLLASALYAYAVLFPSSADADRPSPYSVQFQHATSFYNLALTQVLSGARRRGQGHAGKRQLRSAVRGGQRDRGSGQPKDGRRPADGIIRTDDKFEGAGVQK